MEGFNDRRKKIGFKTIFTGKNEDDAFRGLHPFPMNYQSVSLPTLHYRSK